MLTMRPAQVQSFSEAEITHFVEETATHLNKFFPEQCKALGDSKLLTAIRYGIKRAAAYQITAKSDVTKYLDLGIVFGADFDRDPKLPWAGEILRSRQSSDERMTTLIKFGSTELHDRRAKE
jgi:hypothetical protein